MSPAVEPPALELAPGSVLVYVGLDLVGDGLIKLPFLRALRNAFPHARITWLAGKGKSAYAHGLAPLVRGLLDEVVEEADVGRHWHEALSPALKGTPMEGRRFDLIIDSQRRAGTTLLLRRIPHEHFISGAADYFFSSRRPPKPREKPPAMVQQLLSLVELASGRPADTSGELPGDPRLDALATALLPAGRRYIGLAPGAGGKHKCWPLERYLDLAEALLHAGSTPVVFLGPEESDWAARVAEAVPAALLPLQSQAVEDAGPSPLVTIALARRLSLAVANDAGVGHMMAAANCPLISLFGPTPPEKFAPLVAHARVLRAQDFAGDAAGQTDGAAMEHIPLGAVQAAIDDLLREIEDAQSDKRHLTGQGPPSRGPAGRAAYSEGKVR
ncbi:glycosyltransferase family 9 protein [Pelagibius sp. CAU 1746]|uniref:glycosyltransferase family 9 protein n=1 Tax=Pelagibius sp. CAU 1746 TaxID=3140370 RepID=UPI00325BA331